MQFFKTLFVVFFFLTGILFAQDKPTIYLIGDSTMSNKKNPETNPEHGWGQVLPELLDENIEVSNHALNGRSSKSFITEGRWEIVLSSLKKGDFVFIQFGHNDQKFKDSTRYTNPFTQYRYNLERYVKEAREAGATPILMSSIVRRKFNEYGTLEDTHGNYPLVVRMVAKDLEVAFIDMQFLTERLEKKWGSQESEKLHLHFKKGENPYYKKDKNDDTHLSYLGAKLVASLALQETVRQNISLEKYIKPEVLEQDIVTLKD
ncbi:rhamnogalacturonan acetylesterase [Leeuwenhoekiella marinoflava]|uniref:Lysophospholipase L1-like esterase n=2 Tax=Leeuwenhoekiella marinoflava TaxID=988 RepID=A0A4Q0PJM8_9FLAO|nr:rhamnogalacturonan acetylesterase [Leeuwenhoekiella marinoflava]RXG27631.1 lysophospholipase L1-like esterase [Leeuwenhoekiella marinoflava]SHF67526.1 Lysophospholipase L1 [Leeuwenhoekiella marinoflava DSM 3653]